MRRVRIGKILIESKWNLKGKSKGIRGTDYRY